MEYIVHKRFRGKCISGEVNLPAMTVCEEKDGIIYHNGNAICAARSENAHQYFARNDDGEGLRRGKLTQAIHKALSTNKDPRTDKVYIARWDKVWNDEFCRKYKRSEYADYWLWNHEFYNAPVGELEYIAVVVGVKCAL